MNKISKKIVALATMAAFVLTLVPAAAFGAPVSSKVSVEESEITLAGDPQKTTAVVDVNLVQADAGANVLVWVTTKGADNKDVMYRHADFVAAPDDQNTATIEAPVDANGNQGIWANYGIFTTNNTAGDYRLGVKLSEAGTYTIHVATNLGIGDQVDKIGDDQLCPEIGSASVTVESPASTVKSITTDPEEVTYNANPDGVSSIGTVTATVKGQYKGSDKTDDVLAGKEVTITAPAGFDVVGDDVKDGKATTDDKGQFSFSLIADKGIVGTYTLTLTCEGVTKNLLITVGEQDTEARTVEAVDTGKDMVSTDTTDLSSVAQVVFKNAAGEAVDVKVGTATDTRIIAAPDDFDGTFGLAKVDNSDNYGLTASENLVPGEYTVRVALVGKDSVDLTFTAENFGKVVDSKIEILNNGIPVTNVYADPVEKNVYTGKIYVVDENGLEKVVKDASNLTLGFIKGSNVGELDGSTINANGTFTFTVNPDPDNKLVGTEVTIMAFSPNAGVNAQTTVTVADPANIENVELQFDSEAGEISQWNNVGIELIDVNGDLVSDVNATGKNAEAIVVSKSNEDANVQVNMGDVTKGKATLKVYSDKETTADIIVVVRDTANNNVMYANTLTYTFGPQDIPVGTTVVMTIGSSDFVINDKVITKEDSAPYVANDRTYVPFRALGEALGAEVVWDNDARTVTYTLGNTEVVMTIGETTYTVNGDEKTMDVAPEITGDRTYVPVRFVGEALGFSVTALYDTNGTTASVVFQK